MFMWLRCGVKRNQMQLLHLENGGKSVGGKRHRGNFFGAPIGSGPRKKQAATTTTPSTPARRCLAAFIGYVFNELHLQCQ